MLCSHPDLPDAFPLRFAPPVPDGIGGVPLFKGLLISDFNRFGFCGFD
jgi:hypothetical protein